MVKTLTLVLIISISLFALESKDENTTISQDTNNSLSMKKQDIFKKNCLSCHANLSFTLENIFFKYLLKYSSEISVKNALVDFLKNPNEDTSVMSKSYIRSFGIKNRTNLSDQKLNKAIGLYWDRYKVFGKLR